MDKVIIIRLGELYLKGKNRSFFENLLIRNIKESLKNFECKLYFGRNRYTVSGFSENKSNDIIEKLSKIFGIASLSEGFGTKTDRDKILESALFCLPDSGSFRVTVNRADKTFPMTSTEYSAKLGGEILDKKPGLTVNPHNPEFELNVDIREDKNAYVFSGKIAGAGGMPVGSSGNGLLLLSGGIDSPVAGYMMSKRGMSLSALHFHSYPYTSEMAKDKVKKLAHIMEDYCGKTELFFAPFTEIQECIHKHCDNKFMITIMRRFMMRIAEKIALKNKLDCIITGESLAQVASQTIQSITATNSVIGSLPVLRPLIGMDKQEILDISKKIGTYETSILPYEDCCTVFLPEYPVIKPSLEACLREEDKMPGKDELIENVLNKLEIYGR